MERDRKEFTERKSISQHNAKQKKKTRTKKLKEVIISTDCPRMRDDEGEKKGNNRKES
jgi:hypothetical protein